MTRLGQSVAWDSDGEPTALRRAWCSPHRPMRRVAVKPTFRPAQTSHSAWKNSATAAGKVMTQGRHREAAGPERLGLHHSRLERQQVLHRRRTKALKVQVFTDAKEALGR